MTFLTSIFLYIAMLPGQWGNNLTNAEKAAQQNNHLILLNFSGSDWCAPCVRLRKEILESSTFLNYAGKNLELVNADFPRQKKHQLSTEQQKLNNEMADRYNAGGSFPLTLLLSADGKIIKRWEGYPNESPEKFIEEVQSAANAAK